MVKLSYKGLFHLCTHVALSNHEEVGKLKITWDPLMQHYYDKK